MQIAHTLVLIQLSVMHSQTYWNKEACTGLTTLACGHFLLTHPHPYCFDPRWPMFSWLLEGKSGLISSWLGNSPAGWNLKLLDAHIVLVIFQRWGTLMDRQHNSTLCAFLMGKRMVLQHWKECMSPVNSSSHCSVVRRLMYPYTIGEVTFSRQHNGN